MTECPSNLEKLPKNSTCVDWKRVPATSSYWRSETKDVERCAKWNTGREEPPKDDDRGDGGTGAFEEVDPDNVDAELDSTWPAVDVWVYDGGRPRDYDGTIYVYVVDSGESKRTSRYLAKLKGDDVSTRTLGRSDDREEAQEIAREWAREHDPRTAITEFDIVVPNEILKPAMNAAHRMGTGARIEVHDDPMPANDFRVLRFVGGGGLSMYTITIPESRFENNLGGDGAFSVDLTRISKVVRDTRKSEDVRFYTDDGRLRVRGASAGSAEIKHSLERQLDPPKGGPAEGLVKTSGRNYRKAVTAIDTLAIRDGDPVAVVVDDKDARLVAETDYQHGEERIRAPLRLVDDEPYNEQGEATIGVRFGGLDSSSRVIPKPASTAVSLFLQAETMDDRPNLTVEYIEAGARFTHYLSAGEEVDDFDLSAPSSVNSPSRIESVGGPICPSDRDTPMKLSEPLLSPGNPAPSWSGTTHTGDTVSQPDDSVVWFFPNTGGCRCSHQALRLEQVASEVDVPVFGVTNNNPDELADMADSLGLERLNLVSDPAGEIADGFGVSLEEGGPERALFFVRDREVIETVDGMAAIEVEQSELNQASTLNPFADYDGFADCVDSNQDKRDPEAYCAAIKNRVESDSDIAEVAQKLTHPSVAVITGARGKGKSSLAYHLADEMSERDGTIPVTVGLPPDKADELPARWMNVESLEAAPHQAVIVVDEAYAKFHAREAMQNVGMAQIVNQSRHCSRSILFVTQNSGHLDKTGVSEADAIFMKEPGPFHMRFERPGVRDMTETAKDSFNQLPGDMDVREYTYVFTDDYEGLVQTGEADFYGDALSKSYSGACSTSDTGTEQLSQPVPCLEELPEGSPAFKFNHGDGSRLDRLND